MGNVKIIVALRAILINNFKFAALLKQANTESSKMEEVIGASEAQLRSVTNTSSGMGRKGVAVTLRISFDKKDCLHLMGLQYLVDRPELSRDRGINCIPSVVNIMRMNMKF